MAQLEPTSYPLPEIDFRDFGRNSAHEQAFAELQEASANLPEGKIVGALYSEQYADGFAHYLVTKARPFTVQHVPYGDAWNLPAAHIRGLNRADVEAKLASNRAWARLIADQQAKRAAEQV